MSSKIWDSRVRIPDDVIGLSFNMGIVKLEQSSLMNYYKHNLEVGKPVSLGDVGHWGETMPSNIGDWSSKGLYATDITGKVERIYAWKFYNERTKHSAWTDFKNLESELRAKYTGLYDISRECNVKPYKGFIQISLYEKLKKGTYTCSGKGRGVQITFYTEDEPSLLLEYHESYERLPLHIRDEESNSFANKNFKSLKENNL